jgi:hypothetical protein
MLASRAAALAQSDAGEIDLAVVDAATEKPLGNVRTFLLGAQTANALTTASGAIAFTDVPVGIYRIRLQLRGFDGATTREFDVLPNRAVHVRVLLSKRIEAPGSTGSNGGASASDSNLKVIGVVSVRPKVSITTTDITADSPIRRLSDSLTDALDKLAGVSITTDTTDPNSPLQISLNNQDESQTALTLDGIPLSAPGAAGNLRGIGSDLFSGSSVSFNPAAGGLAGGVNFSTLQPTQALQIRANATTGTYDRSNYSFATTGSLGSLGFVAEHTWRGANSPLTFRLYEDQSGLTYAHGGESVSESDLLKLRYTLRDERTSITASALDTNRRADQVCAQDVTLLPCGIGPGNSSFGRYSLAYATVQSLVGNVVTTFSGYANSGTQNTSDLNRYLLELVPGAPDPADPSAYVPTLDPSASLTDTLTRGIAYSGSLAQRNHTFTFTGNTYSATNTSTPIAGSPFVTAFTNAATSSRYQFSDAIKSNDELTLTPSVSFANSSGPGGSFIAGLGAAWKPKLRDTYALSLSLGSSQPNLGAVRSFSDPVSARFNCGAGTAVVGGPGDSGEGQPQSASAINASWAHQFNGGASLSVSAYSQVQSGQLIGALIQEPLSYFAAAGPGYLDTLYAAYRAPAVCGLTAAAPVVYVQESVAGTRRLYQGVNASGRFELSPYLALLPSYSVNVAVLEAAGGRLGDGPSTTIVGAQLPNRPLHRGNLTLDGLLPRSATELLANAQFVGANNQQNLGPYVNVSFGVSHRWGPGQVTLFENNAFNAYAGVFATNSYANALALSNGAGYRTAATPLTPRTIFASYTMAIGGAAPGPSFRQFQRASRVASQPTPAPSPSANPRRTGRFTSNPPPPGTDPLALATARDTCDEAAQTDAKALYDALHAYVAAYERGEKPLDVPHLTIVAHKTAATASVPYFLELRPNLPRPPGGLQNGAGGQGDISGSGRRGAGANGPGGGARGGVAGGMPGAEAPAEGGEIVAQSVPQQARTPEQETARRNFQNSPELKAYRSFVGCAYVTLLGEADAQAKGIDVAGGRPGLIYVPGIGIAYVQARQLPQGGGSLKGTR